MPNYTPQTAYQRFLARLNSWPGYIGASSRRKLLRQYKRRARREFDALVAGLTPADVVLDLGANLGKFTEQLARSGAQVHAYEPDPDTFEKLKNRVGHLDNVTLYPKAVAAQAGTLPLHRAADYSSDPDRKSEASSVYYAQGHVDGSAVTMVEVEAFNDVLKRLGNDVTLVKMDIEGSEWDILTDIFAASEPHGFRHLYCETHEFLEEGKIELVHQLRARSDELTSCTVNLYWALTT